MKKDHSIIEKLLNVEFAESYEYQKLLLDIDKKYATYIIEHIKMVHPKILDEYSDIPEILELVAKKYNL
jgi:hypothetical protein